MEVQIYLLENSKELIYDNDQLSEFSNLVGELGLICDNQINKEKSPIPYMWLDEATVRAFQIICPAVHRIEQYPLEIPIEILRNVRLTKTEQYFDWIEIWSNRKDPDPFCVGRVYKEDHSRQQHYTWDADHYLIGRWGHENKSIESLINDAIKIAANKIHIYASTTIAKLNSWKSCPEDWARSYIFNNDKEAAEAINR